jgi:hypothetical protein
MKHTPGPWEARLIPNSLGESNNHWEINGDSPHVRGKHQQICEMNGPWEPSNYKANARLIAAAPDLLEALDGVLVAATRIGRGDVGDVGFAVETIRQKAAQAIAKATGK